MNTKGTKVIVCFHEKNKQSNIVTPESPTKDYLGQLNSQGYGIFETVNEFNATNEQLKFNNHKTKRQKEYLTKLCAVYADLDISKDEDQLAENERESSKEKLINAIEAYCPATYYIITKNGVQPIWTINESSIDQPTQEKYRGVIEGIIEWTKQYGNKGDPVKDVTRLLRVPGYYHLKSEPYLITQREGNGKTYTLDELKTYFWIEQKTESAKESYSQSENPVYNAINRMDIRQVVSDAWAEKENRAEFDSNNHLWIDGVKTATFVGRKGDGNYMATTSSDYPAKGNAVTYVADTLGVSNKEAFKWLIGKYNLESEERYSDTETESDLKTLFEKDKKAGSYQIAQSLVKEYSIKTINGTRKRELYLYRDGIYVQGENFVRSHIQTILQEQTSNHYLNEIIERVKGSTLINREDFEVNKNLINLNNGVLNIETMQLAPHNPQFLFMQKIPVDYNPEATCPEINKFLEDTVGVHYVPIIYEIFGYILYRSYFIKKAVIFYGERDTGKTTLLKLMGQFTGKDNVSGVSLQKLTSDKFAAAHFYQKNVNIFDDLSSEAINDTGALKIATGYGLITGEYKFGDQFQFINYAKLIFACNKIPNVKDLDDEAYFSRWIVIFFGKTVERPDKFLIDKITSKEELSGLLNLALGGLRGLIQNQDFSYKKTPEEIKIEMMRSSSTMANFAYDHLRSAQDEWISKQELYDKYAGYARKKGLAIDTINFFGKHLRKNASYINDSRGSVPDPITKNPKQVTGWRNVKYVDSTDEVMINAEELLESERQDNLL